MWNLLPAEINHCRSHSKQLFFTYISQFPHSPPVLGINHPSENSLLTILMLKGRNPNEYGSPISSEAEVTSTMDHEERMASIS